MVRIRQMFVKEKLFEQIMASLDIEKRLPLLK